MSNREWGHLLAVPILVGVASVASATDYLSVAEAQRVLLPQVQTFVPFPITLSSEQLGQIKRIAGVAQSTSQPKIWRGVSGGSTAGWVLVDEVIGKHELITYAAAISPDGTTLFALNIIPHTSAVTTLGGRAAGESVNLEIDVLARYLGRMEQLRTLAKT